MRKKESVFAILIITSLYLTILLSQFRTISTNPQTTNDFGDTPGHIKQIIKKACYDCHSNHTQLSWYNKLPLIAGRVKKDIEKGRSKINFTEWDKYSEKEQLTILFNVLTKVKNNEMPPQDYKWLHSDSRLTEKDISELETYIKSLPKFQNKLAIGTKVKDYQDQHGRWEKSNEKEKKIEHSPNGIPFPKDYRKWQVVSSSFRIDHNTLRVILGNDVAIDAIAKNEVDPWPDGTILGKVVWEQGNDENWEAALVPSTFVHAEFMFRDSKKYENTMGWGWARWIGNDLKPFGKDKSFTQSCIQCHLPVKNKDYVFTTPSIFP